MQATTLTRHLALALLLAGFAPVAHADAVRVDNAWVRATAPGQQNAAGFMDLTAAADMKLVGGSSPVSASLELHTMSMDGGVMVMRRVAAIDLPRGQTVRLMPGGLHIMFIGLKAPIRAGDTVPVSLTLRDAAGRERALQLQAGARRAGGQDGHHHP